MVAPKTNGMRGNRQPDRQDRTVPRVTALTDDDLALIDRAAELVAAHGDDELHTVAAAARALDGRVVAGATRTPRG
jgi:hypothetical protein